MNLFLNSRRLTCAAEDHLTEFFAAALELDGEFRRSYAGLVLGPFARSHQWAVPEIGKVETQVSFEDPPCRPDMILTLEDGHVIACEHKLEAVQTLLPLGEAPEEPVPQLSRYLKLRIDGLVFVRARLRPPEREVLEHPRYVCPAGKQHFLWRDFYPLLDASHSLFCRWLRDGFVFLGFTPPHPAVGDLSVVENQVNFGSLWTTAKSIAHDKGWAVTTGSRLELYLTKVGSPLVSQVWVCPSNQQLLVRVSPTSTSARDELSLRLNSLVGVVSPNLSVEAHTVRRAHGNIEIIDAWMPLNEVLGDCQSGDEVEARLGNFLHPFLMALGAM
jgi:hypothetical protein